jgi:hypothetical protein
MKYTKKIKSCLQKQKILNYNALSSRKINVEEEIKNLYQLKNILSLFLFSIHQGIITSYNFSINFWKLYEKYSNKTLSSSIITKEEIIVMDILLSFQELLEEYKITENFMKKIYGKEYIE